MSNRVGYFPGLCSSIEKEERGLGVEKKDLQCQLEEACSKAAVGEEKSGQAKDQGYKQGYEESAMFFWELLVTLAPNPFRTEGYFEVHV